MNRRQWILTAAAGAGGLAAGAGVAWWRLAPRAVADAQVAVFFAQALLTPEGQTTALAQWQGQPMVVNFWATWCPPCVEEMPDLEALSQAWAPKNVQFVGIGVDTASNIIQFRQRVPVSYPLLVAGNVGAELARTLGNESGGLPYTVIISAEGRIAHQYLGRVKPEQLEQGLATVTM